jgi:hypothetical protein
MTRLLQALLAVQGRVSYRRLLAWATATALLATGSFCHAGEAIAESTPDRKSVV